MNELTLPEPETIVHCNMIIDDCQMPLYCLLCHCCRPDNYAAPNFASLSEHNLSPTPTASTAPRLQLTASTAPRLLPAVTASTVPRLLKTVRASRPRKLLPKVTASTDSKLVPTVTSSTAPTEATVSIVQYTKVQLFAIVPRPKRSQIEWDANREKIANIAC